MCAAQESCKPKPMPSISKKSTRAITDAHATDNYACVIRAADGHRAMPRYPDGRDFDLCDQEMWAHMSEIRDYREDFT